ncbi:calponin homology domain-containing protein DDB_G0272472-like isoform X18 [Ostrea edulis]|uniref:calponin homology domain-containing protein DDB_G0272472-like isoform X18 n=1 Tax=Ostrea edulis TaxID=37623 RepID=UPI0024AEEB94|nr:calponin homology domain-containing protein DDB_G0272472-like isoform X18 [Ostrea edulis]
MSRNNGYGSYRGSSREIRPPSAELVDLHVYIVPPDIWRERYNNFLNQNVTETISAGIIRVHPERLVYDLRDELDQQVGVEMLPRDYVFLKSVGRSITRLKQKQEYQLKAKHFIPPQAYAPELYLLEISADDRESSRTSTRPQSPYSQNPENHRKRANQNQEPGSGTYTNHTNEDSGINVNSPEDHFDALDRRKQDEDRNDDLHRRLHPENDEHRRNGEEDNDEWERRRREDEERRRREEEERRRREEEEQRREEEERRRLEEERARISKQQLTGSDEGHQYQQIPSSAFTKNSLNFNEGGDPSVNPTSVNYSKEQNSTTVDNSVYGGKHRMKVPGGNKDLVNTYNKDRERSLQNPENSMNYNKERLKVPEMDLNRFPSPPPLQMNDSNEGHDTESSKQNRKAEKERLLKELEAAREARRAVEKQREELVKKAKLMQTKTQNRRNHDMMNIFDARDIWKKRYFEEKKKTPPLEEQCNRLRHELDIIHRKLMNTLEGPSKDKSTKHGDLKPSQKVGDKQEPGQFYPANYRNTGQAPPYNQNYEDGLIRQGYQRALLNNTTENYQEYQPHHANNYYNGQVIPRKMGSPKLPPISPQSKKSSRPSSYYDQTNTYRSPLNSAYHRPYSYQPPTKSGSRFSSPNSVSPNARGNFRSPASSGKSVRFEPSRRNSRGINYY